MSGIRMGVCLDFVLKCKGLFLNTQAIRLSMPGVSAYLIGLYLKSIPVGVSDRSSSILLLLVSIIVL